MQLIGFLQVVILYFIPEITYKIRENAVFVGKNLNIFCNSPFKKKIYSHFALKKAYKKRIFCVFVG